MAIEILNIDCMEYMKKLTHKHGLAVVDPPYGIDGNSHRKNKNRGRLAHSRDYHMALWDQSVPDDEYFNLLFRSSIHQLIFGGNYFRQLGKPFKTPRRSEIDQWLKCYPFGWIAWDKCNGTTGFNDYELIWTSFPNMKSFIFKYMWNGFMQGIGIEKGHLHNPYKKYNEIRIHPAHKPIVLYKFLYKHFKDYSFDIIDTHLGGGSSVIAAHQMGIDITACEIDQVYYEGMVKRFKEQTAQLKLL